MSAGQVRHRRRFRFGTCTVRFRYWIGRFRLFGIVVQPEDPTHRSGHRLRYRRGLKGGVARRPRREFYIRDRRVKGRVDSCSRARRRNQEPVARSRTYGEPGGGQPRSDRVDGRRTRPELDGELSFRQVLAVLGRPRGADCTHESLQGGRVRDFERHLYSDLGRGHGCALDPGPAREDRPRGSQVRPYRRVGACEAELGRAHPSSPRVLAATRQAIRRPSDPHDAHALYLLLGEQEVCPVGIRARRRPLSQSQRNESSTLASSLSSSRAFHEEFPPIGGERSGSRKGATVRGRPPSFRRQYSSARKGPTLICRRPFTNGIGH